MKMLATLRYLRGLGDATAVLELASQSPGEVALDPELARIVGWAHRNQGKMAEAWEVLSQAHRAHPTDLELTLDLAESGFAAGKLPESVAALERLIAPWLPGGAAGEQRSGPPPDALSCRILTGWAATGQSDRAQQLLKNYRTPPPPDVVHAFAECFDAAARSGKREVALTGIERLVRFFPDDSALGLRLAELELDDGNGEVASGRIQEILSRSPGHMMALLLSRRAANLMNAQRIQELRLLIDKSGPGGVSPRISFSFSGSQYEAPASAGYLDAIANRDQVVENELKVALARYLTRASAPEEAMKILQSVRIPESFLLGPIAALKAHLWHSRGFPDLALAELKQVPFAELLESEQIDGIKLMIDLTDQAGRPSEALRIAKAATRLREVDWTPWITKLEAKTKTRIETDDALAEEAAASAQSDKSGEVLAGEFEILTTLGQGGMGVVLKVQNNRLGRMEALKFLPQQLSEDANAVARLRREAQILSTLSHPGIVRVYGMGVHEGRPFVRMELLEGETLTVFMRRVGRLPIREVLRVGQLMGAALQSAHASGIVHRDVKPDNIMLLAGSRDVKLMDFGLAQDVGTSSGARRESFMGTIHYISPEQINGQDVDGRTDIYSFGVVLYEMLTGQTPFDSPNPHNLMFMHLTRPAPSPRILRPEVSVGLTTLIAKCLDKAPARRPSDFSEVLQLLTESVPSGGE